MMCTERRASPRAQAGLTLIELMVTLSVLVILTTVGVPSFRVLLHNNRVAVVSNELTLALTLARSEAVRRGAPVQLCASTDGDTCGGDWADGWIMLTPSESDPLRVWQPSFPDLGPVEQDGVAVITFNGLGVLPDGGAAFVVGWGDEDGMRARLIDLAPSGRLALKTYHPADDAS